jgi:hypothetical protein
MKRSRARPKRDWRRENKWIPSTHTRSSHNDGVTSCGLNVADVPINDVADCKNCISVNTIPRMDLSNPPVGTRFGKFVVEKTHSIRTHSGTRNTKVCCCVCDCGARKTVIATHLKNGNTKSCGCLVRRPPGESGFNTLLYRYRKKASARRLEFSLSVDDFRRLVTGACHYCGVPPKQEVYGTLGTSKRRASFTYNGIDRSDNDIGYTIDNCVTCCGSCNMAKRNMPAGKFVEWIRRIYVYQNTSGAL